MLAIHETTQAAATGTPTWAVIVVGLAAALIGAFGTGIFKMWTEAKARLAEAQVKALYGLQEGADQYRRVMIDIGSKEERLTRKEQRAYDKAESWLGVVSDRVECDVVREHCEEWRQLAEWAWRDVEEVTPAMEIDAWNRLRDDIRKEFRRFDA